MSPTFKEIKQNGKFRYYNTIYSRREEEKEKNIRKKMKKRKRRGTKI